MSIKVKDVEYDEINDYVGFNAVINDGEEIRCTVMKQDIEIEDNNLDKDIYDAIWKFGDDLRTIVYKSINNILAEYEGRTI